MIKESVTINEVIEILNEAVARDREAINNLISSRVGCNKVLADHPTIQVRFNYIEHSVGLLGVLNGLFGIDDISGWGAITAVINDEDGILEEFTRTDIKKIRENIPT